MGALTEFLNLVTTIARFIDAIQKPSNIATSFGDIWDAASAEVDSDTRAEMKNAFLRAQKRKLKGEEADALAKKTAQGQRPGAPNFDFRGSRFQITQAFAEGFDPDRIAVAFANDLATLGERKLQSGFSPMFAVR